MLSLGIGLGVNRGGFVAAEAATPATDPEVSAIATDGWRITYDTPPTEFDPVGDPKYLAVERAGFSDVAASAFRDELIPIMKRVRQPDPNETTLTASTAALGRFVFSGDKLYSSTGVSAGITNNSTFAAPKPVACWLHHDRDTAESSTFTVRLLVLHAYGRQGKPVAGVRFSGTDGANTETVDVNTVSKVTYTISGLSVCCYEGAFTMSDFDDVSIVTFDAKIYPWVGAVFDTATDADTYPSPNLTSLKIFNNYQGTAAPIYAYVDGTGAGGGTASTNAATAAADPFATGQAALAAVETLDGTDADRAVIRFTNDAAFHTLGDCSGVTVTNRPPMLTRDPLDAKSGVIVRPVAGNNADHLCDFIHFYDLTMEIAATGTNRQFSNAATDSTNLVVCENVTFGDNSLAPDRTFISDVGRLYVIECDGDDVALLNFFGTDTKELALVLGCAGNLLTHSSSNSTLYNAVANDFSAANSFRVSLHSANSGMTAKAGCVVAFNKIAHSNTGGGIIFWRSTTLAVSARGIAVVGNVVEEFGASAQPMLSLQADNDGGTGTAGMLNAVVQMNTIWGERTNVGYNDASPYAAKYSFETGNIYSEWNTKHDVTASDSDAVEAWAVAYHVDHAYNVYSVGSTSEDAPGAGALIGEVLPIGSGIGTDASPIDPGFADDNSHVGGDDGDGDYTPTAGNLSSYVLPGERVPIGYDLEGNAIPVDGSAVPGAIQAA